MTVRADKGKSIAVRQAFDKLWLYLHRYWKSDCDGACHAMVMMMSVTSRIAGFHHQTSWVRYCRNCVSLHDPFAVEKWKSLRNTFEGCQLSAVLRRFLILQHVQRRSSHTQDGCEYSYLVLGLQTTTILLCEINQDLKLRTRKEVTNDIAYVWNVRLQRPTISNCHISGSIRSRKPRAWIFRIECHR